MVLRCTYMKDVKKRDETWAVEKRGKLYVTQNSHIKFAGQVSGCSQKFDLELSETK